MSRECLDDDSLLLFSRILSFETVMGAERSGSDGAIGAGVKVSLCEILRKYQLKYQQDSAHIRHLIM